MRGMRPNEGCVQLGGNYGVIKINWIVRMELDDRAELLKRLAGVQNDNNKIKSV